MISACLFGLSTNFLGNASRAWEALQPVLRRAMEQGFEFFPVCPEQLGGLPTPRHPAEVRAEERVVDCRGHDVSAQFHRGGQVVLSLAETLSARTAILKSNSPSCGKDRIHDGTFTGTLIPGHGITTRMLQDKGLKVLSESEFLALAASHRTFAFLTG